MVIIGNYWEALMEKKKSLKLCNHCDGQIELDSVFCPYCGTEVRAEKEGQTNERGRTSKSLSAEETLSSLYPPPYQPKGLEAPFEKEAVMATEESKKEVNESSALWPILCLSVGFNFLLLSLFLLLFSGRDELIFKWNTHLWFVYLIISAPLIYFGYRRSSQI